MSRVLIAMGANIAGLWGLPKQSLQHGIQQLNRHGVRVIRQSPVYSTRPVGGPEQPDYANAVISATTGLAPVALLRLCKRLEYSAGRRQGPVNGPRPLDLDIIAYGCRVTGWRAPRLRRRGGLVLPHPEAHRRAFVLQPLVDVAPHWVHPVLRVSARELLRRLHPKPGAVVLIQC